MQPQTGIPAELTTPLGSRKLNGEALLMRKILELELAAFQPTRTTPKLTLTPYNHPFGLKTVEQHEKEHRQKRHEQEQSHDQQGFSSGAWHGQLRGIKQ